MSRRLPQPGQNMRASSSHIVPAIDNNTAHRDSTGRENTLAEQILLMNALSLAQRRPQRFNPAWQNEENAKRLTCAKRLVDFRNGQSHGPKEGGNRMYGLETTSEKTDNYDADIFSSVVGQSRRDDVHRQEVDKKIDTDERLWKGELRDRNHGRSLKLSNDMFDAEDLRLRLSQEQRRLAMKISRRETYDQRLRGLRGRRTTTIAHCKRARPATGAEILQDYNHQLKMLEWRASRTPGHDDRIPQNSRNDSISSSLLGTGHHVADDGYFSSTPGGKDKHWPRCQDSPTGSTSVPPYQESFEQRRLRAILQLRNQPALKLRGGGGDGKGKAPEEDGKELGEEPNREVEYDENDQMQVEYESSRGDGAEQESENWRRFLTSQDDVYANRRRDAALRDYQQHIMNLQSRNMLEKHADTPRNYTVPPQKSDSTQPLLTGGNKHEEKKRQDSPPMQTENNTNASKRHDLANYLTEGGIVQKEFRAAELFDAQPPWGDFRNQNKDEGPSSWVRRHEGEGGHGNESQAKMAAVHDEPRSLEREIKSLERGGKGSFLHIVGAEKESDDKQNALLEQHKSNTENSRGGDTSERTTSDTQSDAHSYKDEGCVSKSQQEKAGSDFEPLRQTHDKQNVEAFKTARGDLNSPRSQETHHPDERFKSPFQERRVVELETPPYDADDDDNESTTWSEVLRQEPPGSKTLLAFRQQLDLVHETDERRKREASRIQRSAKSD